MGWMPSKPGAFLGFKSLMYISTFAGAQRSIATSLWGGVRRWNDGIGWSGEKWRLFLLGIVGRLRTRLKCPSTTVWDSSCKPSSTLGVSFKVDLYCEVEFYIGNRLKSWLLIHILPANQVGAKELIQFKNKDFV